MSDNPFSEPEFDDRTIIRPAPGGRRTMAVPGSPATVPGVSPRVVSPAGPPPQTAAAPPVVQPPLSAAPSAALDAAVETVSSPAISVSPMSEAASPVLQLLGGLQRLKQQGNAQQLHDIAVRELRAFERQARDAGIKMDLLRPAHYALCATIDDLVLNTPWGGASGWGSKTLVAAFHPAMRGTDPFFDQLRQVRKDPAKFLPVIELMYLCLSFGFMGRLRRSPADWEHERNETYAVIAAQRKSTDQELSAQWRGIVTPRPSRWRLPVWVVLVAAVAICGGLFFWVSTGLNAASDVLQAESLTAPPGHMPRLTRAAIVQPLPPPPAAAELGILDRLRGALKPDIDQGRVSVLGSAATPVIRIADRGVFGTGSATVQASAVPLLERVGAALKGAAGSLLVVAYTDNQPIRTVRFPSNFQLSAARAQAVQAVIARSMGDAVHVGAEGRADADPIASNATAEGREQNRRVEIVWRRQE